MDVWVSDYIGKPWRAYASGPVEYDCHGLVWHCLGKYFHLQVGRYREVITNDFAAFDQAIRGEKATNDWVRLDRPQRGCVVLMGSPKFIHHIGLWVDVNGGRCLHSRRRHGVLLDVLETVGRDFLQVEFWIHKDLLK